MLLDNKDNFMTNVQTVSPSFKMKQAHCHDRWEMFFLVSGNCTMQFDEMSYHVESGGVILIPAGVSHKTTYLSGCAHTRHVLYFDAKELDWICNQLGQDMVDLLKDHFVVQIPTKHIAYVTELISKMEYEHNGIDELSEMFDRAYFYELILYLARCRHYKESVVTKMDVANETIQKVIEHIIHNYDQEITLSETSKIFGMSESGLSKKFKAFTGYRFKEYLVDVRTHAAADMLLHTSQPMTVIADRCGFSDSNTFGNTFKRIFGCSPSTYRKEH